MNKRIKKKLKTKRLAGAMSGIRPGVCYLLISKDELAQFDLTEMCVELDHNFPELYRASLAADEMERAKCLLRNHKTYVQLTGVLSRVTKL